MLPKKRKKMLLASGANTERTAQARRSWASLQLLAGDGSMAPRMIQVFMVIVGDPPCYDIIMGGEGRGPVKPLQIPLSDFGSQLDDLGGIPFLLSTPLDRQNFPPYPGQESKDPSL
jgi:hypothetical protein